MGQSFTVIGTRLSSSILIHVHVDRGTEYMLGWGQRIATRTAWC